MRPGLRYISSRDAEGWPKAPEHFGMFDIETEGFGGPFIVGGTITLEENGLVFKQWTSAEEMFAYMVEHGHSALCKPSCRKVFRWGAHNGAKFDFSYLAVELVKWLEKEGRSATCVPQGNKIIAVKPHEKMMIFDTLPLLKGSLDRVTEAFAPEYRKLGKCSAHDMSGPGKWYDPACTECGEYLRRDCEGLWHAYQGAQDAYYRAFDVWPGLTTGSTALRAWCRTLNSCYVYHRRSAKVENFLRNFTTGSFIYPGETAERRENRLTVDRGAAFAAAMLEGGYPTDVPVYVGDQVDMHDGSLYYMECDVYVPEGTRPMIPLVREGKKLWATGSGTAYVISEFWDRLVAAGYRMTVKHAYRYDRREDIFTPFVRKCEELEYPGLPDCRDNGFTHCEPCRQLELEECTHDGKPVCTDKHACKDKAIKSSAKSCRNDLNGKFQAKDVTSAVFIGYPSKEHIDVAVQPTDDHGLPLPWYTIPENTVIQYHHPEWYALTVMRQMFEEFRIRDLMPDGSVDKFDTDSATSAATVIEKGIENGDIRLGPGYGWYKVEHIWAWLISLGPKNYVGYDLAIDPETGKEVGLVDHSKGIPPRLLKEHHEEHLRAAAGEKVTLSWEGVLTFKKMIQDRPKTPAVNRKRSIQTAKKVDGWAYDEETSSFRPYHRE